MLTSDEIREVETNAKNNPALRLEHAIGFFGEGHKTIYKISPIHGLILIKGNEETGFEHIHARHEFWSIKPNWKESVEGEKKLENPSRFNRSSIPILHYVKIVDAIYGENNINIEKNYSPEKLDMYTGEYIELDGSKSFYHLLTYKNSKIIHTLYPQSKKNNQKSPNKLNFARGRVKATQYPTKHQYEIKIPYLNAEGMTVYSIIIRKHTEINKEQVFIIDNSNGEQEKTFYLGERKSVNFKSSTHELITYQYTDLRVFERIIIEIDKNQK